jgi:hypothetical protein
MGIKVYNNLPSNIKLLSNNKKVFRKALLLFLQFHSFYSVMSFYYMIWIVIVSYNKYTSWVDLSKITVIKLTLDYNSYDILLWFKYICRDGPCKECMIWHETTVLSL